jgi:hypothetical protein
MRILVVEDEDALREDLRSQLVASGFGVDVAADGEDGLFAGLNSRMDFLLKPELCVIETKMTRKGLAAREVGEQLVVDIHKYKEHPSCSTLFCLVYDPEHRISNPRGFERDLSGTREGLDVRVFTVPRDAWHLGARESNDDAPTQRRSGRFRNSFSGNKTSALNGPAR